jgi:hypothetical protein
MWLQIMFSFSYYVIKLTNSQVTLMKMLTIKCWLLVSHCYYSVNIVSFSLHGSDPIRRVPIFRIPWNQSQYAEMNQLAMREFLFSLKILNWLKFRNIKVTLPLISNQLHYSGSCWKCSLNISSVILWDQIEKVEEMYT